MFSRPSVSHISEGASTVSRRGRETGSGDETMIKYLGVVSRNQYDGVTNTTGLINMGSSTNKLMDIEVGARLRRDDVMRFTAADHQHYFDFAGTPRLREALADFFRRHFTGGRTVSPEHIIVMNGVTSCLDALAYGCCDAGDVVITTAPGYGRIHTDFQDRATAEVEQIVLSARGASGKDKVFELTAEMLEDKLTAVTVEGKTVRAVVLMNPHNPLGWVYSQELILQLLQVCARHKVHAIVDEIYALSVHSADTKFKSVLSFDKLPDPDRTHFLWGLSKDMCLPGLRVGVIHTSNSDLLSYLRVVSMYHGTASIVHESVATILNDKEWCDDFFLPTSRERLAEHYHLAVRQLTEGGVRPLPAQGGLFVFVDASDFLREQTQEDELALFDSLVSSGVFVSPGSTFRCPIPGWFRIVVTLPKEELRLGIERLLQGLKKHKTNGASNTEHCTKH